VGVVNITAVSSRAIYSINIIISFSSNHIIIPIFCSGCRSYK